VQAQVLQYPTHIADSSSNNPPSCLLCFSFQIVAQSLNPLQPAPKKPPAWCYSNTKKLLIVNILARRCTDDMEPEDMYLMHADYQLFPFKNFKTNLSNLHKAIQ
jgi:hypothetical protein